MSANDQLDATRDASEPLRKMALYSDVREQLLRDMWLRHDGLWYASIVKELDFHDVNRINRNVIERLARYEMISLIRKIKPNNILESLETLLELFTLAQDIYQTRVSPITICLTGEQTFKVSIANCWACRTVSRAGMLDKYECGPWMRLIGWLAALEIEAEIRSVPTQCIASETGNIPDSCEVNVQLLTPFPISFEDMSQKFLKKLFL